jgi:hypothetical protein
MTLIDQCREAASKAIAEGGDVLPPWTGDDRAMGLWLDQGLRAAQSASHVIRVLKVAYAKPAATAIDINSRAFAIEEARCGNIGPLRRLEPELAEFLHLQKRKVGQRFPKRKIKEDRVTRYMILFTTSMCVSVVRFHGDPIHANPDQRRSGAQRR